MIQLWFLYAFIASILTALAAIIQKKALKKEHTIEFAAVLALVIFILSIPLFFFIDYSQLTLPSIILLLISTNLGGVAFFLTAKSMRHMEISEVVPLASLIPGVTTVLAIIFLKEIPTINQGIGIILLIIGAYTLEAKGLKFTKTLEVFKKSKYIRYLLLGVFIYGCTAVLERVLLAYYHINIITFLAFDHLFLAIHFFLLISLFKTDYKGIKHSYKKAGFLILLVALFVIGYRFAEAQSIKLANVALGVSIKRLSIFFTVIIGGELFHEKNLLKKTIASLIMIAGVIFIAL